MKQVYLTFFAAISAFGLQAQITITEDNIPDVGDEYTFIFHSNPSYGPGSAGADQTFDFSTATGVSNTLEYNAASTGSISSTFPDADIVETDGSGVELYHNRTSSVMELEGMYMAGVIEVIHTDPRAFLSYPMSYEDSYSDTFDGTAENLMAELVLDRGGDVEITADAYGELILPYATIEDVLRVVTVYDYSDEYLGVTLATYTDSIFTYFNESNGVWLGAYSVGYGNGALMVSQFAYLSEVDFINSVIENDYVKNINVYPNPATDHIVIENAQEIDAFTLMGVDGRVHQQIQGGIMQQRVELNNSLSSGIYYLQFLHKGQQFSKKIMIK